MPTASPSPFRCCSYHGAQIVLWMTQLPASNEDGLKNYFTLAYHVAFDSNPFWFDGMKLPTRRTPCFHRRTTIGGYCVVVSRHISSHSRLASLALATPADCFLLPGVGLLLFRILKGEGGSLWLSASLAAGIMLLSPQWFRLGGHYSLGPRHRHSPGHLFALEMDKGRMGRIGH